jgi:hypothetical protein
VTKPYQNGEKYLKQLIFGVTRLPSFPLEIMKHEKKPSQKEVIEIISDEAQILYVQTRNLNQLS